MPLLLITYIFQNGSENTKRVFRQVLSAIAYSLQATHIHQLIDCSVPENMSRIYAALLAEINVSIEFPYKIGVFACLRGFGKAYRLIDEVHDIRAVCIQAEAMQRIRFLPLRVIRPFPHIFLALQKILCN